MSRFKETTGAEAAQKLIQNGVNGSDRWAQNAAAAAAFAKTQAQKASEKWKQGVQAAVQRDGFAKGVANSDPATTAATIAALGPGVHSQGLQSRAPKIQSKFEKLMPKINAVAREVNAMKADTPADRKAKMNANFEKMSAIKGTV